jgi:5-methylcytosine-specific restriction endonuclease McrA
MKKCAKCKQEKESKDFVKRKSNSDGLDSTCLMCMRENSKNNSNKNRDKNKKCGIIITHKYCNGCSKEKEIVHFGTCPSKKDGFRSECKECRNKKDNFNYHNKIVDGVPFKELESIRFAKMHIKFRDKFIARSKLWSKLNKDRAAEATHKRRAKKAGQTEFNIPINYIDILKENQQNKCKYCTVDLDQDNMPDTKKNIDHIISLSRNGKHEFPNLVLACRKCNFNKHARTLEKWLDHNKILKSKSKNEYEINKINIICENIIKLMETKTNGIIL